MLFDRNEHAENELYINKNATNDAENQRLKKCYVVFLYILCKRAENRLHFVNDYYTIRNSQSASPQRRDGDVRICSQAPELFSIRVLLVYRSKKDGG